MSLLCVSLGPPQRCVRYSRNKTHVVSSMTRTQRDLNHLARVTYRSAMQLAVPLLLYAYSPEALPAELHTVPLGDASSYGVLDANRGEVPKVFVAEVGTAVEQTSQRCEPLCEESYGFLPCSVNPGGSLFLMVTYGFFLLLAARFISEGSELLLKVMNPGIIGGLLLPILGALPDALLVVASGSGGTAAEAQREVMVGVGVLAGSTTLILTLAWAGSLWFGRCDISPVDGKAEEGVLSRKYDFFQTGVTTDTQTRWGAWVMMLSTVPLVCVQVPLIDGHPAEGPEAALVGSVISCVGLVAYCSYQVLFPWFQQKRIEEARLNFLKTRVLQGVSSYNSKLSSRKDKAPLFVGRETLENIFKYFDVNGDGKIEEQELKGLIVGLGVEEDGYVLSANLIDKWLQEFDVDANHMIAEHEFVDGLNKWAGEAAKVKQLHKLQQLETSYDSSFWAAQAGEAEKVLQLLEEDLDDVDDAGESEPPSSSSIYVKAVLYLVSGAGLAAMFADPLVNSIEGFAKATQVPPFFIAFVVTPLASNASELFSSIAFAMKKRRRSISLTFSQIYGAVTMNNTLCLGIFLGLVHTRGLTWDFSSEVTAILFATFTVGLLGASRTTFPSWLAVPVLLLYPLSVAGIAFLDNYLGWH